MTKRTTLLSVSLAVIFIIGLIFTGCSTGDSSKIKVVTSTSLLAYITQQVGGDRIEVINLIPPAQHPGDFNVKPSDIETLANAQLFLLHGWPGEGYAEKFIASANNPKLTVIKATTDGNWMIPSVQSAATDKVAAALSQVDVNNAAAYQKAANEYKQRITAKEADIKAKLAKAAISQISVLSSGMQADFLKWVGLTVVATYGAPVTLTPQVVKELIDKGKAAKVSLLIDNLQNGKDAGKAMAEEIGAKQLNLSNFPGGFDNTETWEKAIDRNIELLLQAIAK